MALPLFFNGSVRHALLSWRKPVSTVDQVIFSVLLTENTPNLRRDQKIQQGCTRDPE